jgi:23S rRNA-/tRNA-specific pseudouridylate synthase
MTTATTVTTNVVDLYAKPLEVIYQDACMAVINKPQGMTVMGGRPSLIRCDLLMPLACTSSEKEESVSQILSDKALGKPRPVHRLDSATGGLLVIAKTHVADQKLRTAFMNRKCHKRYRALLIGKLDLTSPDVPLPPYTTLCNSNDEDSADTHPPSNSTMDSTLPVPKPDAVILADVDGKVSQTWIRVVRYMNPAHYMLDKPKEREDEIHDSTTTGSTNKNDKNEVKSGTQSMSISSTVAETQSEHTVIHASSSSTTTTSSRWYTMVDLWPVTGRRHQLRKHMKLIGYSIYGDTRYIASSILAERYQQHQHQHISTTLPSSLPLPQPSPSPQNEALQLPPSSFSPPSPPPLCLWAMEITIPHPYTGIKMTFTVPNHDDPDWFRPIFA